MEAGNNETDRETWEDCRRFGRESQEKNRDGHGGIAFISAGWAGRVFSHAAGLALEVGRCWLFSNRRRSKYPGLSSAPK